MNPRIFYDNRFDDGAAIATSTASGTAADNLFDWRPYTWWQGVSPLPATITVDCSSAKTADSLFIYGHDLYSKGGCTVQVRGSTDNFAASNVLVHSYTPASDDPFARTFTQASYRYWRLLIDRGVGAGAMPSLAIIAIGNKFDLDGYLSADFDPLGRSLIGVSNRNESGQPLGKVADFEEWKQTITMQRTSWTWLRSTFIPAWSAHLRATPFGFQWFPLVDTTPLLVTAGDQLRTPHHVTQLADYSFDLQAAL